MAKAMKSGSSGKYAGFVPSSVIGKSGGTNTFSTTQKKSCDLHKKFYAKIS